MPCSLFAEGSRQADEALRLAPDVSEARLALGLCYYRLDADYEKALHELDIAGATLPNNSEILNFSGTFIGGKAAGGKRSPSFNARANSILEALLLAACPRRCVYYASGRQRVRPSIMVWNSNHNSLMAGLA